MGRKLAFVLSGGGAYGALQVGALRALFESGIHPDMLVGTSIGAVNATYLALHGLNLDSVQRLTNAWQDVVGVEILPPNYIWLSVRALLGRPDERSPQLMHDFFTAHGLKPGTLFKDIQGVQLILVAADLNSGAPVLFGKDENQSVLEGVLASTALPPWMRPMQRDEQYLVDGGFVSNLPIEPALAMGATEIIALDLVSPMGSLHDKKDTRPFWGKTLQTVLNRQRELELALAAARGIPVYDIVLHSKTEIPLWDFDHTPGLIEQGYEIARVQLKLLEFT